MRVFLCSKSFARRIEEFCADLEYFVADLSLQNNGQVSKPRDWNSLPSTIALPIIISVKGTLPGKISSAKVSQNLNELPKHGTFKLNSGR